MQSNVIAFPSPTRPNLDAPANAYTLPEWVHSARQRRSEMRRLLAVGFYKPLPDFTAALEDLEQLLERYAHIR